MHELMGGSSSVAERQLPKLNVAGSIPVSRSSFFSPAPAFSDQTPARYFTRSTQSTLTHFRLLNLQDEVGDRFVCFQNHLVC